MSGSQTEMGPSRQSLHRTSLADVRMVAEIKSRHRKGFREQPWHERKDTRVTRTSPRGAKVCESVVDLRQLSRRAQFQSTVLRTIWPAASKSKRSTGASVESRIVRRCMQCMVQRVSRLLPLEKPTARHRQNQAKSLDISHEHFSYHAPHDASRDAFVAGRYSHRSLVRV